GAPVRGDALVRPRQWHRTRTFDASIVVLGGLTHDVSRRGAYLAYLGTGEHPARLRILGPAALAPGEAGLARIDLPTALPLLPGDRYVLRESGRDETVGGGEVLDVDPVLTLGKAAPSRSVDRVVAERGWVDSTELERLTGERRPATLERWVVDPEALAAALATAESIVDGAAPGLGLDVAGLDERVRALLGLLADVEVVGGRARRRTGVDPLLSHPFVAALEASPFAPPAPDGVDRGELAELVRRGLVIAVDGVWFAPTAVDAAARAVAVLLAAHPEGVTVAAVRDTLGTTRKYLLPLLAQLDASGVTRRRGDVRVAGPRLPALPPPAQGEL
ncbi:MAG: SelB C-terminal domain-containing protein, partial [Actinomycetota bacterium]|nr:SelB C-terminal domain-containing protein [Actinomycetota bacterium]